MSDFIKQLAANIYTPIAFLLVFGGLFFIFYSRFIQYKYFFHAINILRGKYTRSDDPGQISAYQALSTALASTVGMGNIAGVAAAISLGGPGALFWMWITAFVGMSTNFFTTTLSLMYRGKDEEGVLQGGPMYVIREAMSKRWYPLAILFSVCAMVGCLPIFQANQLTQAILDIGIDSERVNTFFLHFMGFKVNAAKLGIGIVLTLLSSIVVLGGIERIGNWAGKMVPLMILIYFGIVCFILIMNIQAVPGVFKMIFVDAFTAEHYHGNPVMGGVVGGLIIAGIRRASFSSEAGIGTAPMALSAAKCREPVREGLVSMLSPAIDTLVVCTLTGFAILVTDVWQTSEADGVSLTAQALGVAIGDMGRYLLLLCGFFFSITSIFSYSYYGHKSMVFVAGAKAGKFYIYIYLATIVVSAVASMRDIMNIIDIAYAIMAIPTMVSAIILAPKVMAEVKRYFAKQ